MSVLTEIHTTVRDVAERAAPSVVGLGRGWGVGAGVAITDDTVLTAAHVLRGDELTVLAAGERHEATVVGIDHDLDLAVLKVKGGGLQPITWEPDAIEELSLGSPVIALADPGGRGLRATLGFVSAERRPFRGPRGRRVAGGIEHTAPLPRGSSGGPLVDPAGRLLGLNVIRLEGGLILAVPADAAVRERVEALARGEAPARPRLGVAVAPPRVARKLRRAVGLPERDGVLVRAVEEGSAAERAGVTRGDLIVAAGGRVIDGIDALHEALDATPAEGKLALTVVRGSEEHALEVSFP